MGTRTCNICGEPVEFRYVDGSRRPIHTSGACAGGSQGGRAGSLKTDTKRSQQDNICIKTNCPKCHESVYFIRHNGGSVWIDELGWPWPKHPCIYDDIKHRTDQYDIFSILKPGDHLGLVIKSITYSDQNYYAKLVAISTSSMSVICLLIDDRKSNINAGDVVCVCDVGEEFANLTNSGGRPCRGRIVDPKQLKLGENLVAKAHLAKSRPILPSPTKSISTPEWAICPECGASVSPKNLSRHLRRIHGIDLPSPPN